MKKLILAACLALSPPARLALPVAVPLVLSACKTSTMQGEYISIGKNKKAVSDALNSWADYVWATKKANELLMPGSIQNAATLKLSASETAVQASLVRYNVAESIALSQIHGSDPEQMLASGPLLAAGAEFVALTKNLSK